MTRYNENKKQTRRVFCVGGVGSRQRCSSTDRLHRRTRLHLTTRQQPPTSNSSSSSSQPPTSNSQRARTLDRGAGLDTASLQYATCGAVRPPARRTRCPADGGSGLVLMKLGDRASRRDPDVVQNCTICRQAAAASAGFVQADGMDHHQRRTNNHGMDEVNDDIPSHDDRY